MMWQGLTTFLGGFLIWNLDNLYCSTIRPWRHNLGLPWAVVLEGHAWWHLMTGIGGKLGHVQLPLLPLSVSLSPASLELTEAFQD